MGADVDGVAGLVSAPRHRVGVLMLITAEVVRRGSCSASFLSSLLGLWVHVLLFRRPAFSLLSICFQEACHVPRDEVFRLDRRALNELQSLSLLAPLLQADLRVQYLPHIYAMDASPSSAGLCIADVPTHVSRELWRHTEQRGYYTKLESPAAALLREQGHNCEAVFGPPDASTALLMSGFVAPVPKHLAEGLIYDTVEVFSGEGNWSAAHCAAGLETHPGIDIAGRNLRVMDILDDAVFHEVLSLALRRVAREWHGVPPCLTFGTLRRPRLRSKIKPHGFHPNDPLTLTHNRMAQRTGFLFCVVARLGGFFSVEQPGSSVMFRLHIFGVLASLGAVLTRFCCCSYGSPFMKPMQWLRNKPWLVPLAGGCACAHKNRHLVIQGSFTAEYLAEFNARCKPSATAVFSREPRLGEPVAAFSASYPLPLCHRMASGSRQAKEGSCAVLPLSLRASAVTALSTVSACELPDLSEVEVEQRLFHDDPEWINDLAESLPFREVLRYKFARQNHINVQETRTYKTWLKYLCKHHRRSRAVGLIDSRVLLGASAKGRSSSPALAHVLRTALPYILGGGLYPGGLHVYSAANRSDGPSRNRPVDPPSKPVPLWFDRLCEGDPYLFDVCLAASAVPKQAARWLRFLLLLAGDIERNPGPAPVPRGPLDLTSGFAASTRHKMHKSLEAFALWLREELGLSLHQALSSVSAAALALRGYGLHLYAAGLPRYLLVYAITSVQDACPEYRNHLTPAWQIDKKWQHAEPGECRPVISQPILQAAISVGLLWGWGDWVAVTLIGFVCMLHPAELIALHRRDLILPADAMTCDRIAYVHVRNPKTARFARRQHARLDDELVLRFIEARFGTLPLSEKLFRGSMHTYCRQWNAIMHHLDVPHTQAAKGATPGVLRGSGATFLYLETEDVQLVAWRGRWSKLKTVEFYLQEVAAQRLLQQLSATSRAKIAILRKYASRLVALHSNPLDPV